MGGAAKEARPAAGAGSRESGAGSREPGAESQEPLMLSTGIKN
jgi:hypothetical protein